MTDTDRLSQIKARLKIKSGYSTYVRDDMEWFVTEIEKTREAGRCRRDCARRDTSYLSKLREEGACTLEDAAACFPGAPLVGGPVVALAAVRLGAVDRAVVTTVGVRLDRGVSAAALLDALGARLGDPVRVATVPEALVWRRA